MHESEDTLTRFERRFRAIEGEIPDRPFATLLHGARPRSRYAVRSPAVGAAILVVLALIVVPPALRRSDSSVVGGPSAAPVSVEPSPTPRMLTTGEATWTVTCDATSDADCDGAVGLFVNNLARSWKTILDESGGRLTVEARTCPTFNGLTADACWDVTAIRPNGPVCMVVAYDANDPAYPGYFQIGGEAGGGQAGGPPDGWPMCLDASLPSQ
jgi:hypothetical protein